MFDFVLQRYCSHELIYPGSEVPGWFSHRSMESSITIQFPLNCDQFKGVVFCIIFEFRKPSEELYNFDSYFYGFKMDGVDLDNSGEVRKGLLSYKSDVRPNSNHVLIVYESDVRPFKKYSGTLSSFQFCLIVLNRYSLKEEKNNEILKQSLL